jgi:hypothetical protein
VIAIMGEYIESIAKNAVFAEISLVAVALAFFCQGCHGTEDPSHQWFFLLFFLRPCPLLCEEFTEIWVEFLGLLHPSFIGVERHCNAAV